MKKIDKAMVARMLAVKEPEPERHCGLTDQEKDMGLTAFLAGLFLVTYEIDGDINRLSHDTVMLHFRVWGDFIEKYPKSLVRHDFEEAGYIL